MPHFSPEYFDTFRKKGFRPQVVGCFLYEKRVLFLFKRKYAIWQFPQGGIDNHETAEHALYREMREELSKSLARFKEDDAVYIGEDSVRFPFGKRGEKGLVTNEGKEMTMRGKQYFFYAIPVDTDTVSINKTEFDKYRWVSYIEAHDLIKSIYQRGKRRVITQALKILYDKSYIR